MASSIYYFTGTGNSLTAARSIAEELGECRLAPMVGYRDVPEVVDDSDIVGLVFPEFFLKMPDIVAEFAGKLRLKPGAYVFAVATYGAVAGTVLSDLDGLLKKNGTGLSSGFMLKMPDNYIIFLTMPVAEEEKRILIEADSQLAHIRETIKKREHLPVKGHHPVLSTLYGPFSRWISDTFYGASRMFWTTGDCNGCGTCKKICPMKNIEVTDKKVTWGANCVQCLACVHWCPNEAIQIGGRTLKKKRYRHPEATLKDMIRQASDKK